MRQIEVNTTLFIIPCHGVHDPVYIEVMVKYSSNSFSRFILPLVSKMIPWNNNSIDKTQDRNLGIHLIFTYNFILKNKEIALQSRFITTTPL